MSAGAALALLALLTLLNGVNLTIALACVDNNQLQYVRRPGLTGYLPVAALKPVFVAEGIAGGLVVVARWLWLARPAVRRRSWARRQGLRWRATSTTFLKRQDLALLPGGDR